MKKKRTKKNQAGHPQSAGKACQLCLSRLIYPQFDPQLGHRLSVGPSHQIGVVGLWCHQTRQRKGNRRENDALNAYVVFPYHHGCPLIGLPNVAGLESDYAPVVAPEDRDQTVRIWW